MCRYHCAIYVLCYMIYSSSISYSVLSCTHSRSFWVQWDNDGKVSLGSGQAFANPIIDYTDRNDNYPAISSLSLTSGIAQRAMWNFQKDQGKNSRRFFWRFMLFNKNLHPIQKPTMFV